MSKHFGLILAAVGVLGGCAALGLPEHVDATDYNTVASKIEREADAHKQVVELRAPLSYYRDGSMMWPEYFLRASRASSGRLVNLQLYVIAAFGDWAFLNRAWSHGERLDVVEISREVATCQYGCVVKEHVGINLTLEQLSDYAERGLSVKIEGNRGHKLLEVPAAYFRAFRDALLKDQ